MKSACQTTRPLLSALRDGELPEERASLLREHLESCDDCRQELHSIREVVRLLEARTEPDPHFLTRFRARRAEDSLRLPWRMLALRLVPLCLAALLGGGLAVWTSLENNGFDALEAAVLEPVAFESDSDADPVLGITLEPFAEQEH